MKFYNEAELLEPDLPGLELFYALVYAKTGDRARSEQFLAAAVAKDPNARQRFSMTFYKKKPEMKQYGLLGYPLSHSFSKGYFTEKFRKEGIDAVYDNFALPSIAELPELIAYSPFLAGFNVTIPYKQAVIPYLDALDPVADAVGAVNVVRILRSGEDLRLIGYNSDVIGFRESIRPLVEALGPEPLKALVLGHWRRLQSHRIWPEAIGRRNAAGVQTDGARAAFVRAIEACLLR